MSDILDGLSNYTNLTSNIDALKAAQSNSSSALTSSSSTSASGLTDPQTFRLQTEQNFNQMLNTLMSTSNDKSDETSSDPLSSLINSYQSSSTSQTLDSASLQRMSDMEKNSPLLGRVVSYFDAQTGEQKSGKIDSISFTSNASAMLNLSNGDTINAGAVVSISE